MLSTVRKSQAGLSLVELMVSGLLGMILVLAIVQVFHNSKNTVVLQQAVTLMQENGRFAVKSLRHDLAIAGFSGCRVDSWFGSIVKNSHVSANWHLKGPGFVRGYDQLDSNGSWPSEFRRNGSGGKAYDNTDAIVVRGGDAGLAFDVKSSDLVLSKIELQADATTVQESFERGDLLLVANKICSRQTLFHLDDIIDRSLYFRDVGNPTGNCTAKLWAKVAEGVAPYRYRDCNTPLEFDNGSPLTAGSQVMRFRAVAYYVGGSGENGDGPIPTLRRVYTENNLGTLEFRDEEVVEGVELMQIRYGYDDDGDGIANLQVRANDSVVGTSAYWDDEAWANVVNAKITLVLRSTHATETEPGAEITVEGVTIPGDRYLRTVVSTLVELRNRVPRS